MNKKAYQKPECCIIKMLGRNLMISASGGEGSVQLNYSQEEDNADMGLSRRYDCWADEE